MRLLLDSHAFLWFVGGDASLSATARAAFEDPANEKYVSYASAWELAIQVSLGKLKLHVTYHDLFPGALVANGFRELSTKSSALRGTAVPASPSPRPV